jgi:hypothetical protein
LEVVIIEDADDAPVVCETANRGKVTAILNLSDGMLSDFLCLHVLCTINCSAADIDHALLRPGRLVSHRVFRRLDIAQASRHPTRPFANPIFLTAKSSDFHLAARRNTFLRMFLSGFPARQLHQGDAIVPTNASQSTSFLAGIPSIPPWHPNHCHPSSQRLRYGKAHREGEKGFGLVGSARCG